MSERISAEREAELEHLRERIRNGWRISDELGMPPSEAHRVWEMVALEMKFVCSNLDRCLTVAGYARDWVKTGNPFYIDGAVYLCSLSGIEPPPALSKQVAEVAKDRFFNDAKSGTADQILKDNARGFALAMMAKLCAAGATRERAASKVARYIYEMRSGITFKASTLEKYYSDVWRRIETDMRKLFADEPDHLAEWQRALFAMPEADEEQKGNRRE